MGALVKAHSSPTIYELRVHTVDLYRAVRLLPVIPPLTNASDHRGCDLVQARRRSGRDFVQVNQGHLDEASGSIAPRIRDKTECRHTRSTAALSDESVSCG